MNRRELVVVIFLSAVFLSGALINTYKKWQLRRQLATLPVALSYPAEVQTDTLIDINTATIEQLDALPGIGPVLAQRIIAYRERHGGFKDVNELRKISGIGPKRFAAIRELIICRPLKPEKSAD
ncbi:MAG: ComEA family DNA-binding protein [candidate division WOR-3 bacterium]|jgi:comEA protein